MPRCLARILPGQVVGTHSYPFNTMDRREEVPEPIELPESIMPMLKDLSADDIELLKDGRKLFISFDIDVIDPAFTVATGTPVPGGLEMRESIAIVRRLCSEANVIGFDLIKLHPTLDPTYRTAQNSVYIIKACISGLAIRKEGITEEHYLSPVSNEHAIDDYYRDQQKLIDASATEDFTEEEKNEEER